MIAEMRSNLPALVVRAALAGLLACCVLLTAACGGGGLESPEAVFARVQELNASGELRKIWDLYTEDERQRQSSAYEQYKSFLQRNPVQSNREKCIENFRVEPEELMRMTPVEIYVQQVSEPSRRTWLEGARILSKEPAPDIPDAVRVTWETAQGMKSTMIAQYVDGGWYLVTLRE
jgi:hypothetical protein